MADPLWINEAAPGGPPAYSANEMRQAMALALMYDGRNMGARKGVRPGGNQLSVSYAAPTITVQPGLCYLDPALTTPQGGYWVAIPAAETFTLTPADATNPRKDIVIARVYDHDEDASGLRLARTEYLVGTPNPSPAEPAVPAGAIKLALLDVPASPGAVVVTDRRPWTVGPGGILPVALAGDIAAGTEGRYRDRLDLNLLERDSGAAWETVADPAMFKAWTTYTPTPTAPTPPTLGNSTLAGRYRLVGKTLDVSISLQIGSTFVPGSGVYEFPLPPSLAAVSHRRGVGGAYVLDSSASTNFSGVAFLKGTGTAIQAVFGSTALSATAPVTWANGDEIRLDMQFEVV